MKDHYFFTFQSRKYQTVFIEIYDFMNKKQVCSFQIKDKNEGINYGDWDYYRESVYLWNQKRIQG